MHMKDLKIKILTLNRKRKMNIKTFWNKVLKKSRLSSIRGSIINKTSKVESGCNIVNTVMDRYSFCGYNCEIIDSKIGAFCSIANDVKIGGAMHPIDWVSTSPVFYKGRDSVRKKFVEYERPLDNKTIIGNDVWIGQGALIKQGITIGNGAVVGMGSIVTKDVPPYAIVAGNPARIIRMRFSDEIIEQLEETRWWELDDEKISKCAEFIKEPLKFTEAVKRVNRI